jgi:hypothetical protein
MAAKKTNARKNAGKGAGAKKTSGRKGGSKAANTRKVAAKKATPAASLPNIAATDLPEAQELLLRGLNAKQSPNPKPIRMIDLEKRLMESNVKFKVDTRKLLTSVNKINPEGLIPVGEMPEDIKKSLLSLKPEVKRFHGAKISLAWFPFHWVKSPCADKFCYMSPAAVRNATRLPFNVVNQVLLGNLGDMMGDSGREGPTDSPIPAGFTYVGQFVDHDVTLDVSSSLDASTDARTINNMRSPALDLDSLYGSGPALDPFLYVFPTSGNLTAIRFLLGSNIATGAGGPGGSSGFGGMKVQKDFDVPRMNNPLDPAASTNTAVIGDPRNDENLIISQFHQAMLRFHNKVVDLLVLAGFGGDIFVEAKKIVTHHYQWAVINDFLERVCGNAAMTTAMANVVAPVGSRFCMPVEFAVAAYRFGHSMIRNGYWLSFVHPGASLAQVFQFNRSPLPVQSDRVVDFNAFFDTGISVPVNNKARKIDSVLANGLESIPGGSGIMAVLATRNLRRALALGLPSGQGMAGFFGVPAMTTAELTQGLPANEVAVLNSNGGVLLQKTPLWYYVLREAAVLQSGDQMGPVGARIVADTFVRMLKRDANSFVNVAGGFTPMLPSATAGDFTFADLVNFAGVTQP